MGCLLTTTRSIPKEDDENIDRDNISLLDEVLSMNDVFKRYKFDRRLLAGETSRVVIAAHKKNPDDQVSIKILDKIPSNKWHYQEEVKVLKILIPDVIIPQRGISPLLCFGEDSNNYYVVTRALKGDQLFDRITSKSDKYKITEKIAIGWCKKMLLSLKYCHDENIIHSNLKPENFVFADNSPKSDLVLINFGSGIIVNDDETYEHVTGSAEYLAPELAAAALEVRRNKGQKVNDNVPNAKPRNGAILKASDVYSMGVITYVMMTGTVPFTAAGEDIISVYEATCTQTLTFADIDARYHHRLELSDSFKDFMRKMLEKDPLKRITLQEAINHPWVQSYGTLENTDDVCISEETINYSLVQGYETLAITDDV